MARNDLSDCPICRHTDSETIMSGIFDDRFGAPGTYDIVRCRHCGLEQTWPRPNAGELKALDEQFYNWGGACWFIVSRAYSFRGSVKKFC